MLVATVVFMAVPEQLLSIFSDSDTIRQLGCHALRLISLSFVPAGLVMMVVVYFQGVERGRASVFITVLRQVVLLVPLAWLFHFAGLGYVWLTFAVTEFIAAVTSLALLWRGARTEV